LKFELGRFHHTYLNKVNTLAYVGTAALATSIPIMLHVGYSLYSNMYDEIAQAQISSIRKV
jgi:hypothetical protein